jgi:hypothetical protein
MSLAPQSWPFVGLLVLTHLRSSADRARCTRDHWGQSVPSDLSKSEIELGWPVVTWCPQAEQSLAQDPVIVSQLRPARRLDLAQRPAACELIGIL